MSRRTVITAEEHSRPYWPIHGFDSRFVRGNMKKRAILLIAAASVLGIATFGNSARAEKLKSKQPTINEWKWSIRPLPFRPVSITESNGSLWVCGLSETIAVSTDEGATWTVRHQVPQGDMLLKIAFVDERIGHAAGTGGIVLTTVDGGQTWTKQSGDQTVRDFSFANSKVGIANVSGHVKLTFDAGGHWQNVGAVENDPKVKPFALAESVAALDEKHFTVALHQDQGENIMLSTEDGGENWVPAHLQNTFASELLVRGGEYWAFGIEYLGREHDPSGGYSAPVALYSRDGKSWEHGVKASTEFTDCNVQGCSLRYGVIEDLYGAKEEIWSLPQDSELSGQWAMVGSTVCTVSGTLKCGKALSTEVPQPLNSSGMIDVMLNSQPFLTDCLKCEIPKIPSPASLGGRPMAAKGITVLIAVNRDGTVGTVDVKNMPSKELRDGIVKEISSWLIALAHVNGTTVAVQKQLNLGIMCFPKWPNSSEQPLCTVSPESLFEKLQ